MKKNIIRDSFKTFALFSFFHDCVHVQKYNYNNFDSVYKNKC